MTILKPKHKITVVDNIGIKPISPPLGFMQSAENLERLAAARQRGDLDAEFDRMFPPEPDEAPKPKRKRK